MSKYELIEQIENELATLNERMDKLEDQKKRLVMLTKLREHNNFNIMRIDDQGTITVTIGASKYQAKLGVEKTQRIREYVVDLIEESNVIIEGIIEG